MSKIIEKTVVDKYAPRDTNVDWLDVSGDKPVKKSYINGKWQVISGGGSADSSNPTEADVTKVWQVTPVQNGTKTEIETFEVFPEKSFVMSSSVLDAQNVDKFNVGNTAIITINGVTYTSEIQDNNGSSQVVIVTNPDDETISNTFYIIRRGSVLDFDFNNRIPPQPTIASLSVEDKQEVLTYDYNWAPGVKIPIPTAEDEGKILMVNKVEVGSEEYELAPTQTVTITEESVILQNTSNLDKFVEGATVTLVIDGITYTEQVINDEGALYAAIDNGNYFLDLVGYGGESELMFTGSPETYEISVSVLGKEYSYEYQLQSGDNSNGLSIPAFHWGNGDNYVLYDELPKVNDIIYFAYSVDELTTRLFPIVVTSISEDAFRVTGTFMQFGDYYNITGSDSLSKVEIGLSNTNFGTNQQVCIGHGIDGYHVYYSAGGGPS